MDDKQIEMSLKELLDFAPHALESTYAFMKSWESVDNSLSNENTKELIKSIVKDEYATDEKAAEIIDRLKNENQLLSNTLDLIKEQKILMILDIFEQACKTDYRTVKRLIREGERGNTTSERRKEIADKINNDRTLYLMTRFISVEGETARKFIRLDDLIFNDVTVQKYGIDVDFGGLYKLSDFSIIVQILTETKITDALETFCERWKDTENCIFSFNEDGFLIITKKEKKIYQTKNRLNKIRQEKGVNVTSVPKTISDTTFKGFRGAFKWYRPQIGKKPNYAGLLPLNDDLRIEDGRLFLKENGLDMTENYSMHLSNGDYDSYIISANHDLRLIGAAVSVFVQARNHAGSIPERLTVDVSEFTKSIYSETERHDQNVNIIKRMRDVQLSTMGVFRTTRKNEIGAVKTYHAYFPVIVFLGMDEETATLSFSMPYCEELIKRMEPAQLEEAKKQKENLKRTKKTVEELQKELPLFHDWILSELDNQKDKKAVAIVKELVQVIATCGYKTRAYSNGTVRNEYKVKYKNKNNTELLYPHISVSDLIERVPELKKSLELTENADTQTRRKETKRNYKILNSVFTHTWEYMKEYTLVEQKYPDIKYPGVNIHNVEDLVNEEREKWIPTTKTKDNLMIEFFLLTDEERAEKKKRKKG